MHPRKPRGIFSSARSSLPKRKPLGMYSVEACSEGQVSIDLAASLLCKIIDGQWLTSAGRPIRKALNLEQASTDLACVTSEIFSRKHSKGFSFR